MDFLKWDIKKAYLGKKIRKEIAIGLLLFKQHYLIQIMLGTKLPLSPYISVTSVARRFDIPSVCTHKFCIRLRSGYFVSAGAFSSYSVQRSLR